MRMTGVKKKTEKEKKEEETKKEKKAQSEFITVVIILNLIIANSRQVCIKWTILCRKELARQTFIWPSHFFQISFNVRSVVCVHSPCMHCTRVPTPIMPPFVFESRLTICSIA